MVEPGEVFDLGTGKGVFCLKTAAYM